MNEKREIIGNHYLDGQQYLMIGRLIIFTHHFYQIIVLNECYKPVLYGQIGITHLRP